MRALIRKGRRQRRRLRWIERLTKPEDLSPEVVSSAGYWRRLGASAGLSVSVAMGAEAAAELARATANQVADEVWRQGSRLGELRVQLKREGFFTLLPSELCADRGMLRSLRAGASKLKARGWPATMLLLYDEMWLLLAHVSRLMKAVTGCSPSFDTLAWHVDPAEGEGGFAPHRDRQPADVPGSFRPDGSPKYATLWLALSPATPSNSCLHVIPRQHDPGYDAGAALGPTSSFSDLNQRAAASGLAKAPRASRVPRARAHACGGARASNTARARTQSTPRHGRNS